MKAIERYVFGSFLSSFALAFLVLSFVLTIGLMVQIVSYIIDGMPFGLIGQFAAVSFPETLQWTIPLALLVSSVLVFSRMSADSEIAAMRACGINLLTVMKYPVLFALGCSLVCMWINNEIVPRGHEVRRSLTSRLSADNAMDLIEPGVWISDFPGLRFYAARKEGNRLYDVEVVSPLSSTERDRAEDGKEDRRAADADEPRKTVFYTYKADCVVVSGAEREVVFELQNATCTPISADNPGTASAKTYYDRQAFGDVKYRKRAKDFRFFEVLRKIGEDRDDVAKAFDAAKAAAAAGPEADEDEETFAARVKKLKTKAKNCRRELSKTKVELSKRFVFALASFCFVLIGIPLGIQAQRKESTVGMAISLAVALGYYLFVMLMLSLQKSYAIHPETLIFLPVGICLALSGWFVKRNL